MKNKLKKIIGILSITTLLFTFSCTEDLYQNADKTLENRKFEVKHKSFNELMKEKEFNKAYKSVNQKIQTERLSGKTVMEEMYNFTIDTITINEVIAEKYTSYSIGIERDTVNPNFYENLFIEIDSTEAPQAAIIKYNINPITKEVISVTGKLIEYNISSTGKIAPITGGIECVTVTITTSYPCGCAGHYPEQCNGCSSSPAYSTTSSSTVCFDTFIPGGGPSNTSTGNSPTSTGGGGNSNTIFAPRIFTPKEKRMKDFVKVKLETPEQKQCFNDLPENTKNEILSYLENEITVDGFGSTEEEYSQSEVSFTLEALEALCNGGEVDFNLQVILDSSFINSPKIKCLYDKLLNSPTNNLFKDMIQLFSNSTNKNLKFSVGNVIGDFGITNGNMNTPNDYNIIIDDNLENYSNLAVITTLCHELIHAFMFDSLEDVGYIAFDLNGQPYITASVTCPAYVGLNINTLTIEQKFEILICALNNTGNLNTQWSHELFNSNVFSSQAFRVSLQNFLQINHDWNNETAIFKNQCINIFGISNWVNETATAASWLGLEYTTDFNAYLNVYTPIQKSFIQDLTTNLISSKSNCP